MTIKHEVTIVTYSDKDELELYWLVTYTTEDELDVADIRLDSVKAFYFIEDTQYEVVLPVTLFNQELLKKTLPSDDEIEAICWDDVDQRNKAWADDYDY